MIISACWLMTPPVAPRCPSMRPEAEPILAALAEKGWTLTDIWLTHHHHDHIGAVGELKAKFPQARVVGSRKDASRLPPLDLAVGEGRRSAAWRRRRRW